MSSSIQEKSPPKVWLPNAPSGCFLSCHYAIISLKPLVLVSEISSCDLSRVWYCVCKSCSQCNYAMLSKYAKYLMANFMHMLCKTHLMHEIIQIDLHQTVTLQHIYPHFSCWWTQFLFNVRHSAKDVKERFSMLRWHSDSSSSVSASKDPKTTTPKLTAEAAISWSKSLDNLLNDKSM
jgi:hypothetical protein